MSSLDLTFHPVTPDRWADLEALFGPRGACGGCWCMYWRLRRSEFEQLKGEGNRQFLKSIVEVGEVPGLLAYHDGRPVGWVSVDLYIPVWPLPSARRVFKKSCAALKPARS